MNSEYNDIKLSNHTSRTRQMRKNSTIVNSKIVKNGAGAAAKSLDIDQSNRNKSVPKILHSPNLSKRMKVQLVSNVDQSETEELDVKR
jgi:hypothetical protein